MAHTAVTQSTHITNSAKLLDGAGSGTGTNCTAAQLNARLAAGHSVQAPITATSSLGVADVLEVTNVIEANTAGTSAGAFDYF